MAECPFAGRRFWNDDFKSAAIVFLFRVARHVAELHTRGKRGNRAKRLVVRVGTDDASTDANSALLTWSTERYLSRCDLRLTASVLSPKASKVHSCFFFKVRPLAFTYIFTTACIIRIHECKYTARRTLNPNVSAVKYLSWALTSPTIQVEFGWPQSPFEWPFRAAIFIYKVLLETGTVPW